MKIKVEVELDNSFCVYSDVTAIIAGLQFLTIEYKNSTIVKGSVMFDFDHIKSCKIKVQREEEE